MSQFISGSLKALLGFVIGMAGAILVVAASAGAMSTEGAIPIWPDVVTWQPFPAYALLALAGFVFAILVTSTTVLVPFLDWRDAGLVAFYVLGTGLLAILLGPAMLILGPPILYLFYSLYIHVVEPSSSSLALGGTRMWIDSTEQAFFVQDRNEPEPEPFRLGSVEMKIEEFTRTVRQGWTSKNVKTGTAGIRIHELRVPEDVMHLVCEGLSEAPSYAKEPTPRAFVKARHARRFKRWARRHRAVLSPDYEGIRKQWEKKRCEQLSLLRSRAGFKSRDDVLETLQMNYEGQTTLYFGVRKDGEASYEASDLKWRGSISEMVEATPGRIRLADGRMLAYSSRDIDARIKRLRFK